MQKTIAIGIAAGGLAASLMMSRYLGGFGSIILVFMVPLPLFLVGLTYGTASAAIAGLTGSILSLYSGVDSGLLFLLGFALPAGILVRQALLKGSEPAMPQAVAWIPPGQLVLWLAGLATALFGIVMLVSAGHDGGLLGVLQRYVQLVQTEMMKAVPAGSETEQALPALLNSIIPLIPGTMMAGWMLILVANGALAQGVAVRFGWNLRPSPAMAALVLPRGLSVFFAVALAAAHWGSGISELVGLTMTYILATAYILQGLAVCHALARRAAMPTLVLTVGYLLLVISGLPLATLGLIEEWVGIRRRIAVAPSDQERK